MKFNRLILVSLLLIGALAFLAINKMRRTSITGWPPDHSSKIGIDWNAQAELEKIKEQLRKNPESSFWHNQAAVVYAELEDYKNFELEIMKAIELEPDNPNHYYITAAVYKQLGNHDREQEFVWKALEIDSNNPLGEYWLADIYARKEEWDSAVLQYELTTRVLKRVSGDQYIDSHRNYYDVSGLHESLPKALEKARKRAAGNKQK